MAASFLTCAQPHVIRSTSSARWSILLPTPWNQAALGKSTALGLRYKLQMVLTAPTNEAGLGQTHAPLASGVE